MVSGLFELSQQVQFKGVGAGPVIHLDQFAYLVVLVGDRFTPIVIDALHQIKGCVGIFCDIAVGISLRHQVSIAVVDVQGAVAQGVDLLGHQVSAVILVQGDLMAVHVIDWRSMEISWSFLL